MEKCVECESVYNQKDSDATQSSVFCSKECELVFVERMYKHIEFI